LSGEVFVLANARTAAVLRHAPSKLFTVLPVDASRELALDVMGGGSALHATP
jgi:hypothetical protein